MMLMNSQEVITLVCFQNLGECRGLPGSRRGFSALKKDVVIWVGGNAQLARRLDRMRMAPNQLK
jgi:hypothetical protein